MASLGVLNLGYMGEKAREKAIDIVLEEYRNLQTEKRLAQQVATTIGALLIAGSVGAFAITPKLEDTQWIIATLPFAQFAVLGLSILASGMSTRFGMYLAVVERRLNALAGQKLIHWETRGPENWGGISTLFREYVPLLSTYALILFLIGVFIAVESWYGHRWLDQWPGPSTSGPLLTVTVPVLNWVWNLSYSREWVSQAYVVIILVSAGLLLRFLWWQNVRASSLYRQYLREEQTWHGGVEIDIYDSSLGFQELTVLADTVKQIALRNVGTKSHEFQILRTRRDPNLGRSVDPNDPTTLKPGRKADILIGPGDASVTVMIDEP